VCDKYPGSHWISHFERLAGLENLRVISGKQAYQEILDKQVNPKDVLVVQEQVNEYGQKCINENAVASLVMCLESPLYDPFFYDRLPEIKKLFKSSLLFGSLGTHKAYFPSFDEHGTRTLIPFEERTKHVCIVASNKHYSMFQNVRQNALRSQAFSNAIQNQLQDDRYRLIMTMKADIYGKGWGAKGVEIPPGEKVSKLREYQYSICIENIAMDGYVTEKIIECLVAGNIPIYRGAPDISSFVPKCCYDSISCPTEDPNQMIRDGQTFLDSSDGKRFSYQSFAKTVMDCILG
jgi:hypothetical protein